jgi:hypothetical protein
VYDIIRRRLNMENPHKQWLAVDLVRRVLASCGERLRPFRTDLLVDVARVAVKPNKKGTIAAQQSARRAAIDLLHQCGDEGYQAMQIVRSQLGGLPAGFGLPGGAGYGGAGGGFAPGELGDGRFQTAPGQGALRACPRPCRLAPVFALCLCAPARGMNLSAMSMARFTALLWSHPSGVACRWLKVNGQRGGVDQAAYASNRQCAAALRRPNC